MEDGVSHKIAMQGQLFQGQVQIIPGKSKMIHADHHITLLGEMPNCVKIESDFFSWGSFLQTVLENLGVDEDWR